MKEALLSERIELEMKSSITPVPASVTPPLPVRPLPAEPFYGLFKMHPFYNPFYAAYYNPMPFGMAWLAPESKRPAADLPRSSPPAERDVDRDRFGIDEDRLALIRTKEIVAAMSFLEDRDPSFTPDQRRRLRELTARLDKYGCGLARYVHLSERNAEGWLRRLEGMVESAFEANELQSQRTARQVQTALGGF